MSQMGDKALENTLRTLRAMANGGIHDHVGQVSQKPYERQSLHSSC